MRIISLLAVFLSLCLVSAQERGRKTQQPDQRIPATLAEAHAELERILPAEELAKIDAMPSEHDMSKYHFGLGMAIRNDWGLWQGGPLAKHMRELGFTDPDIMSGVILETFWCKRRGQDFRLEQRAANSKKSGQIHQKLQEEQEIRARESKAAIRNMMIGLRFEKRAVPVIRIPIGDGPSVRFMCPFRDGVFVTAYCRWPLREGPVLADGYYTDPASGETRRRLEMDDCVVRGLYLGPDLESRKTEPGDSFYTLGFYLDPKDRKIRRIRMAEVDEVYAAVVVGERAWFAGLTDGKPVLVGIGDQDRITVPLPQADEIPDLGLDGQSLLAVYSKTMYRLTDHQWSIVHSGDILLPRSGLPPQRHGNMVLLRAEGTDASDGRLWWLAMGAKSRLRLFAREMEELFEPNVEYFRLLANDTGLSDPTVQPGPLMQWALPVAPPGWKETSSYCVTSSGDLWACVANGSFLLRRSKEGRYSIAIAEGSVRFAEAPPGSREMDQSLSVSGVAALPDETLLLVGYTGLYRLKGGELVQELAFTLHDRNGKPVARYQWKPNSVLALGQKSYVIGSDSERGVCLLCQGDDGQWEAQAIDQGDPVVW